jgi:hypothetical protein
MRLSACPARALLLVGILGAPASAQELWSSGFHMNAGPTQGGLREVSQNTGYTFGMGLEIGYQLAKGTQLVGSFGYQWFPGDNKLLSSIPLSVPATGVNPSTYETRNRKLDSAGFQLGMVYRKELSTDLYWQAGLRLGFNKASERDTGSRVTTNGNAISNMGSTSDPNILKVETIASLKDSTAISVGPTAGLGYLINEDKALTLDFTMAKIPGPSAGSKTGWSAEFGFQIRF